MSLNASLAPPSKKWRALITKAWEAHLDKTLVFDYTFLHETVFKNDLFGWVHESPKKRFFVAPITPARLFFIGVVFDSCNPQAQPCILSLPTGCISVGYKFYTLADRSPRIRGYPSEDK